MGHRPCVGISACLLGEPVRYDAGHKRHAWLVDVLGPQVAWVPVCPEVEAGFGTPRETMELVRNDTGAIAMMTTETRRDVSDIMRTYADRGVIELAGAGLNGYVLKADSPSCGMDSPKEMATGRGVFAAAPMARMPELPIVDERQLADLRLRQEFVERVWAHHRASKIGP